MKSTHYDINPPNNNIIQAVVKAQKRYFPMSESMWCPCCLVVLPPSFLEHSDQKLKFNETSKY